MIKVNCETKDTLKLMDMLPFQGNLKKRTSQDISELKESLVNEGLMMPFAIWVNEDKNYLLDGHGRKEALTQMALDGDSDILSFDWPCVLIHADNEASARKALLQITSTYGKVTKQGYKQFCVSIPDYKAPVIQKFIPKPNVQKVQNTKPVSDKTVIKLRVLNDQKDQLLSILKEFTWIEVL